MPRSRNRIVRPDPPPQAEQPDDDVWGSHPEAFDQDDDDLGAPPPIPAQHSEPARPPSDALTALGPPPTNTLEAEKWAHRMLMWQAYEVAMSDIPESVRRKEVRTILRDAKGHVTDAARYDYMQLVREDRDALETKKRAKASAVPVPVAKGGAGKIIPIRRDG